MALRQKLRSRSTVFGGWTSLGHPSITEMLAQSDVDLIGIDLEHSTINLEQSQSIIAAAHAAQTACLPRISSHNGEQVKRLLDSGADGVIVPMVSSPSEVERIVEWVKYPPVGKRSYGVARAHGYGSDFDRYTGEWNRRSVIVIQIESLAGVEAIDKLLSYDEIDGAMIGPYDLSGSLGIAGQLQHPRVTGACERIIEACRRHGKACGTQLIDPTREGVKAAFDSGYTFVVLASDVFILWKWSERMRVLVQATNRERIV